MPDSQGPTGELLATVLGPDYQVGDLIGTGGFAEVFAAFDRRLKRRVAVKVLRAEHRGNAALQERFRREAEAMASLRHPHIIPVYAVGESQGLAYFVMPLLEGQTLAAALEQEPRWSFPEVCRILREAASGLAEAHRTGLIHRDVKPENIFLEGPARRVVIMDFGIAKAIDEQSHGLTATGVLIGSPQFMSPEQAVGDPVDALSDQYSLALVGYRMLAGRVPFEAESVRALLFKQANAEPPALEGLRPDIPSSLNAVITRGLAKERSRRYSDIGQFEAALTQVAGEVAGGFKRQRVEAPLEERWNRALTVLYDRPWRWAAAIVLGLLVFGLAYPRGESRGLREALGARDRAVAVGRRALDSLGIVRGQESRWFNTSSWVQRYLSSVLPPDAADSAARALDVWGWNLSRTVEVDLSRGEYEYGMVSIGGSGRLLSVTTYTADSVPGATISPDSALVLADGFLRRLGHDPAGLGAPRRSQRDLQHRRDHAFVWQLPSRLPRIGSDSLASEITIGVTGDRVSDFYFGSREPRASAWTVSGPAARTIAGLGGVLVLIMTFTSLGIAARRASFDSIQWGTSFRLAVCCLGVTFLGFILPDLPALSSPLLSVVNLGRISASLTTGFLSGNAIGPFGVLIIVVAMAESWLNETRPDLLVGLTSLSRLRLRTPEVLQALPAGVAFGVLLAAARAILALSGRWLLEWPVPPRPAIPAVAVRSDWPVLGVLTEVPGTAMAFAFAMFLMSLAIRRRTPWLAPLAMTALWMVFTYTIRGSSQMTWEALLEGLVAGAATLVMMRHGVLAGGLALFLAPRLPVVADMLWAGGPFLSAGIVGGLVLSAPILLGATTYLQRPRVPTRYPASTPSSAGSPSPSA